MEAAAMVDTSELHVVTCADPRFALGAWITIWSACRCTVERKHLRFHLLTTEPGAPEFAKMLTLAARWDIKLSIERATMESLKHLPATDRLPIYTYLRLLAPGILPGVDKFLYLDSDLLVRSSVYPLYEMLTEDTVAAAVRDYFHYVYSKAGCAKHIPNCASRRMSLYFNAGIMLVNAKAWRDRKVPEQAIAYLDLHASTVLHGDQDALNAVLAGEIKEMDLAWNVQLGALEYFDRVGWPVEREPLRVRRAELLNDARIVHFIGPSKPWADGLRIPYGKEYRKMVADSGWIRWHLIIPWRVGWLASALLATIRRRLPR